MGMRKQDLEKVLARNDRVALSALPSLSNQESYPDKIRGIIEADGFAIQSVLGDATTPVIAYTVGLVESASRSEFIVLAQDDRVAAQLLQAAARRVLNGSMINAGHVFDSVGVHPMRAMSVSVEDGLAICPVFKWLYPNKVTSVRFYQLQAGRRVERALSGAIPEFPATGHQEVRNYLVRTRLNGST